MIFVYCICFIFFILRFLTVVFHLSDMIFSPCPASVLGVNRHRNSSKNSSLYKSPPFIFFQLFFLIYCSLLPLHTISSLLFRCVSGRPLPSSRPTPQRLYARLGAAEFRNIVLYTLTSFFKSTKIFRLGLGHFPK